ncbi:MAG: hypothetical protein WA901_00770 [Phormidesmis sp.]
MLTNCQYQAGFIYSFTWFLGRVRSHSHVFIEKRRAKPSTSSFLLLANQAENQPIEAAIAQQLSFWRLISYC